MFEIEKIELSPFEVTSYWWIETIKNKVQELRYRGNKDVDETVFLEIFNNYTDIEWRKLYLELTKYIIEDVNNYVPTGRYMGIDSFNQDTDLGRHNRLNEELSKILDRTIPDIRLSDNGSKDSVIYTDMFGVYEWYKSCGTRQLSNTYEVNYILTGDKKILDFYNLLVATIVILEKTNKEFKSIDNLRNAFCYEYLKNNSKEPKDEIKSKFNYYFNKMCDDGLILGRSYQKDYFCSYKLNDYKGLELYMNEAKNYSDAVYFEVNKENVIDSDTFGVFMFKNGRNNTCNEMIEAHKFLVGKLYKNKYEKIKDCGIRFVRDLFGFDDRRTFVYQYSKDAINFIKSKYLSDYFKNSIKRLINDNNDGIDDNIKGVLTILDSKKDINEMTEEEIKMIGDIIDNIYKSSKDKEIVNIAGSFEGYLFKLDGEGVCSYIKNNIPKRDLVITFVGTSGLNPRAEYYSYKEYSYLGIDNLVAIFNKILKLDKNYAINFVKMVLDIEDLCTRSFIESFYEFAKNDFQYDELRPINESYNDISKNIKETFVQRIRNILDEISPDFLDEYDEVNNNFAYIYKRKFKF